MPTPRRGVLLLVVLSLLTLFLLLGAAYIVSATRAREAARAYSRLTFGGDEARVPHARMLDAVLVDVLAGSASALKTTGYSASLLGFESLLADKYGTATVSGTATAVSLSGPVLAATVNLESSLRPTDLNGRVLTFLQPGREATSHRIIRATGGSQTNASASQVTLQLDAPARTSPFSAPTTPARVIINGREFAGAAPGNEGWDGYDFANNPYLAVVRSSTASISSSEVLRGSYVNTGTTGRFIAGSGTYTFSPSGTSATCALLTAGMDFNGDFIPDAADNDNDGVADGLFFDFGLPSITDGYGNAVQLRASVLVLPLDGRFNVNAHDGLARTLHSGTTNWPTAVQTGTIPLGSGYGPAEVSGAQLRTGSSARAPLQATGTTFATTENPFLMTITGGPTSRMIGKRSGASGSRYANNQDTQRVGATEGRYGERAPNDWTNIQNRTLALGTSSWFARPGVPGVDDAASRVTDQRSLVNGVSLGIPPLWWTGTGSWAGARGLFNSPPDLHGRMKTLTLSATSAPSSMVPALAFVQPEWSTSSDARETKDDPYEVRLDTRRGLGGSLHDPATDGTSLGSLVDNPFTPAELEAVLRPYDIDANRVPPRLAAMLGSAAEESRLKVTTDSWDTTAITGSASQAVSTWLATTSGNLYGSNALTGIVGGEVSRGERFDLNRPLAAAESVNTGYPAGALASSAYHLQRQAYCKDLYTLLMALNNSSSAAALAQWSANVAEWRDADSRVMPFEYDTNPQNGWGVDGDVSTADGGGDRAVAWGAERPEVVIQEALAWRNSVSGTGGMTITLHRPWRAVAYGTNAALPAEPCDYALDTLSSGASGAPQNLLNLGKKSSADLYSGNNAAYNDVSGETYPIWRMRIVAGGSTTYVRFDTGSTAPGEIVDPTVTSGDQTLKLGVDSTVTVLSGPTITTGGGAVTLNVTGSSRTVPGLRVPGTATSATLFLDRLSDPTMALTPTGTIPGTSVTGSSVWQGTAPDTCPVQYVAVDAATVPVIETSGGAVSGFRARRVTSGGATDFWLTPSAASAVTAANGGSIAVAAPLSSGSTAWFPWPNRPFVSSAELLLVPQGTALEMLENYRRLSPSRAGAVGGGRSIPVPTNVFFDAVHVPTRFAGIHTTSVNALPAATGVEQTVTTVSQLSSFREPGRVNLNVVPSDDVWNAVVAGPLAGPVVTATGSQLSLTGSGNWSPAPATSLAGILALSNASTTVVSDTAATTVLAHDKNPLHEIYTATRLANAATPRSNVFGVWITLQESVANDPDSVKLRRAFYIIDRSVPVGFEPDKANNVWDCVRVRRIIE